MPFPFRRHSAAEDLHRRFVAIRQNSSHAVSRVILIRGRTETLIWAFTQSILQLCYRARTARNWQLDSGHTSLFSNWSKCLTGHILVCFTSFITCFFSFKAGQENLRRVTLHVEELAQGPPSAEVARSLNELGVLNFLQKNHEWVVRWYDTRSLPRRPWDLYTHKPRLWHGSDSNAGPVSTDSLWIQFIRTRQRPFPYVLHDAVSRGSLFRLPVSNLVP